MKNLEDYVESYIAFLDILGFKNKVKKDGFDRIKEIYNIIKTISGDYIDASRSNAQIALTRAAKESDEELLNYNKALKLASIRIMSDSIVISVPASFDESLAVVIDICNCIQEMLYEYNPDFTEPILLRGAIAKGNIYINEDMMFGQGLIDAYLAQEHIAVYPRIILSESVIHSGKCSVDEWGGYGFNGLVQDQTDHYRYIDTLGNWLLVANCGIPIREGGKYEGIKSHIDAVLENYTDKRIREKYLWLRNALERAADVAEYARIHISI